MITINGKNGIKATILADSINKMGKRMITYELEYPRLILAELNTHKMLSKNSYSSRAVPFQKMIAQLNGEPVRYGQANPGMQDKGEDFDGKVLIPGYLFRAFWEYVNHCHPYADPHDLLDGDKLVVNAESAWEFHKFISIGIAGALNDAGYHKQVYNRLTEAHQMQKTVLSGTDMDNFFWLRDHGAADPTIHELARVMAEAKAASTPEFLMPGEWHLPYMDSIRDKFGKKQYFLKGANEIGMPTSQYLTLEDAIKVSCARCAAVSYRNEGYGLEKSLEVYDRLVGDDRKHASAFEHCATPIRDWGYYPHSDPAYPNKVQYNNLWIPMTWEKGITHVTREGRMYSGNLCGWIQFRKLIDGENYVGR